MSIYFNHKSTASQGDDHANPFWMSIMLFFNGFQKLNCIVLSQSCGDFSILMPSIKNMLVYSRDCVFLMMGFQRHACMFLSSRSDHYKFNIFGLSNYVSINPWSPYGASSDFISSDHGLSHDHRQALILTNTDISLIGPLETKSKEKQNNFQTMKWIWKCRLQSGSHFASQQH